MQPSTTMMAICLEMIATTALLLATRIKEIAIKMGSETLATKTLMETVRLCFLSLWHVWKSIALFSGGTLSINWITESKEQVAWVTMTSNIAVTRMGEQRRILRKNELSCISFKPLFLLVILSSGIGYFLWCIVYCFVLTSQTPPRLVRKFVAVVLNADADLHLKAIHARLLVSLDERPQAFLFRINWKTMFKGLFFKLKTLSYEICWRRVSLRGKI